MSQEVNELYQGFKCDIRLPQSRDAIIGADNRISRTVFSAWVIAILQLLYSHGPSRFEEIHKELPGISGKVLSRKLAFLERKGMVIRELIDERPPRTSYHLSESGITTVGLVEPVMMYLRYVDGSRS